MPRDDRAILLAWAVGEWNVALSHLYALRRAGQTVKDGVLHEVESELRDLAAKFMLHMSEAEGYTSDQLPVAVRKARNVCTANQSRLDELLKKKE